VYLFNISANLPQGDDNSPDSFERILSQLSTKIERTSTKLTILRQAWRRFKALFTLYSVIGYIIYVIIVLLVIGRQNVGLYELGGLIGSPIVIYSVRSLLDLYYGKRIAAAESRLEDLQMEQRTTIEKLKAATKYSTTQSLIEKYGGAPASPSFSDMNVSRRPSVASPAGPIGRPQTPQNPPQPPRGSVSPSQPQQPLPANAPVLSPEQIRIQQQLLAQQKAGIPPQFGGQSPVTPPQQLKPSAIGAPQQPQGLGIVPLPTTQPPSQQHIQPEEATAPKWYDRILDVVLGEDETSAKNRFALICGNCRMVNGLAPPGTRSLDDMEQWGCARCGTMNGGKKKKIVLSETESEAEPVRRAPRITRSRVKREDNEDEGEESDDESVRIDGEEEGGRVRRRARKA
jgi:hypothetical protein